MTTKTSGAEGQMTEVKVKRKIRRRLEVVADKECEACFGTGLRVTNKYQSYCRELVVMIDVCPCVRVKARELFAPAREHRP